MSENSTAATPAVTTVTPATPANNQPAGNAGTAPAGTPGTTTEDGYVKLPIAQYRQIERDAARFRSKKGPSVQEKREQRYSPSTPGLDENDDPKVVELMTQNQSLSSENMKLKVSSKVRDLLESDDYKSVPESVKRLIKRNPMAVVDDRAKTIEDAIADIQDYLDDELGSVTTHTTTAPGQSVVKGEETRQTPPINNPAPNSPAVNLSEGTEGKTGAARSTTILQNLFKQK